MANTKSAMKMMRVAQRKRKRNRPVRAAVRTFVATAMKAVDSKKSDATDAVVTAVSELDKAAAKGILHRNNAARRKSRLMRRLNKAAQ